MQTISLEDWAPFSELERMFFEKTSYEYLLGYMALNNISNTEEYFKEYQQVIRKYYFLCEQLKHEVIFPNISSSDITWEVNFGEKYVEIRETTC